MIYKYFNYLVLIFKGAFRKKQFVVIIKTMDKTFNVALLMKVVIQDLMPDASEENIHTWVQMCFFFFCASLKDTPYAPTRVFYRYPNGLVCMGINDVMARKFEYGSITGFMCHLVTKFTKKMVELGNFEQSCDYITSRSREIVWKNCTSQYDILDLDDFPQTQFDQQVIELAWSLIVELAVPIDSLDDSTKECLVNEKHDDNDEKEHNMDSTNSLNT